MLINLFKGGYCVTWFECLIFVTGLCWDECPPQLLAGFLGCVQAFLCRLLDLPIFLFLPPFACRLPPASSMFVTSWSVNTYFQNGVCVWVCVCVCVHAHAWSCPTLCNSMDCSPLGSSVHRIFQARILEWVAISFSRGSSQSRNQTCISCVSCFGRRILYQLHQLGSPSRVINLVKLIFPPWLASPNPDVFWKCRRGLRIQAHLNNNVVSYGLK